MKLAIKFCLSVMENLKVWDEKFNNNYDLYNFCTQSDLGIECTLNNFIALIDDNNDNL